MSLKRLKGKEKERKRKSIFRCSDTKNALQRIIFMMHWNQLLRNDFARMIFLVRLSAQGVLLFFLKTFSLQCYRSRCICFVPISCLWVSATRGYEPINTKNASFMCFNSYFALVQAIYRWIVSAQNTRGQSEQCRIFSASNGRQDQFRCNQL